MKGSDADGDGYILMIEDDPAIQELVRALLSAEGWRTVGVTDGPAGLDWARAHEPSMVILDMNVPLLHGEQIAEELHRLYNGIAILVVSASTQIRQNARHARAFGYLKKPFALNALITAVHVGFTRGRVLEPGLAREFA